MPAAVRWLTNRRTDGLLGWVGPGLDWTVWAGLQLEVQLNGPLALRLHPFESINDLGDYWEG